jgi:hypothetical protein
MYSMPCPLGVIFLPGGTCLPSWIIMVRLGSLRLVISLSYNIMRIGTDFVLFSGYVYTIWYT